MAGQLQVEHQALLKATRERLRGCQESQAFGEILQGVWTWLEEIQERLGTVDSTMGTKEQLEQRLETVQVGRAFGKVVTHQQLSGNVFNCQVLHSIVSVCRV